jgi:hypothetical protein
MEYKNKGVHVGTGSTTVLSAGTETKYLLKTVHASNVYSGDTSFNLSWVDNSNGETYFLAYNITIPQASSFQALDGTFTIDNLDSIQVFSANANSLDISISYMEIINSEG